MLYHNSKHFNVPQIAKAIQFKENLAECIRFFGLKQEDNPAILINLNLYYCRRDLYDGNYSQILGSLGEFLNKHNIINDISYIEDDDGDNYSVRIGFRKDLRENVILSACLLDTIIQVIEGKLKLNEKSIIPKCPKFS